jgi:maltooligosyltrehalose synthase
MPIGRIWNGTTLQLPAEVVSAAYRDVLTARVITATPSGSGRAIALAEALAVLPVAVLEPVG